MIERLEHAFAVLVEVERREEDTMFRQLTLTQRLALDGWLASSESKTGVSGGTVPLDPAAPVSTLHATGGSLNTFSLANGLVVGQRKLVVLGSKAGAGNARVLPALMSGTPGADADDPGRCVRRRHRV